MKRARPSKDTDTAIEVASYFIENIVNLHFLPGSIVSDIDLKSKPKF